MLRSPFLALLLACCSLLPAMGLELADLRLPLTRSEADKVLSRDYSYCVLMDMSVRRSWELPNRTVSVDFSPKEDDKAVIIFIDYTRPVTRSVAHEDAGQILGMEPARWQKVDQKRALRLGMEAAEGFKISGGRYCFRELDEQGKVVRLAYYAATPGEVRWEISQDSRDSGKTALGSRSSAGASEYLWQDEERRRGVSANSSASSLASAAAAVVADAPGGKSAAQPAPMIPRPAEEEGMLDKLKNYAAGLTPTQYAIGGAVLGLLLLWRFIARARAARRRAMVTNYIMNQSRGQGKGRR